MYHLELVGDSKLININLTAATIQMTVNYLGGLTGNKVQTLPKTFLTLQPIPNTSPPMSSLVKVDR